VHLRNFIESAADKVLSGKLATAGFAAVAAQRVVILAYHQVRNPERFEGQLKSLLETWRPISICELIAAGGEGKSLPKRSVLITFDDGDRSLIDVVLPLFLERGIPGAAFIVSGLVGTDNPPWWTEVEMLVEAGAWSESLGVTDRGEAVRTLKRMPDVKRVAVIEDLRSSSKSTGVRTEQLTPGDLRALEDGGMAIGNHTNTHPCLPRCSATKVETEIGDAHRRLESALGHPPRAFAYPNGDWDPRAETVLMELGYEAAFLFDHRTNRVPIRDPLRISRVRVDSATSMDRFRMIVSGLHPVLHRLRGGK
jgi:peptidoglycan/xylan/chitin deacetylase (PgdA/CDA1 family)